jgi:acetyl esterase/lipase
MARSLGTCAVVIVVTAALSASTAPVAVPEQTAGKEANQPRREQRPQGYVGIGFQGNQGSDTPVVAEVTDGGPAAKAGIKPGDVILKVGALPVKDVRCTVEAFRTVEPGKTVTLIVRRMNKETEIRVAVGQRAQQETPSFDPEVAVQTEDYATVRKSFRTNLVRKGPAPQKEPMPSPPAGVSEVEFPSGSLRLKAWVKRPAGDQKRPAVLFLHGGFAFGKEDWGMTRPYRDAGYVVLAPILRGENGQAGTFSLFYDEVDDVLAAADYLRSQPYVDSDRVFVAGHSVGGILTMLSAQASNRFRAAASFSGCTDQVLYCRYGFPRQKIPFDTSDARELQVRSPLAYATSFKCPVRAYFGMKEQHLDKMTRRMVALAKEKGTDAEAIPVEGDHMSAVPAAMRQSIAFFEKK